MPRISLWQNGLHSNDFRFFDKRISEMFTLGGTGIALHKYLGPASTGTGSDDATQPDYLNPTERNIQDLLFLENRDRKYDTDVYILRGHYTTADIDFNLSQFGLFINNDILFITFHLRDMVELIGRKIMSGDVLELQHKKDYYALESDVPVALKRYYVVQDAAEANEGYSQSWWPHLWRVKATPLVDSQEYKDILNNISAGEGSDLNLAQVLSQYDRNIQINDAILEQAENEVPLSGYDTDHLYTVPTNADRTELGNPETVISEDGSTADVVVTTPDKSIEGWLTGDGLAPNGFNVTSGVAFPDNPAEGEYVLRLDYFPNRLFRFNGRRWVKVEDVQRNNYTPGSGSNQKQGFVNNTANVTVGNQTQPSKQGLSQALSNRKKT